MTASRSSGPGDGEGEKPTIRRIGSYRLHEPLGSGGMSSVFRAEHVGSGLVVALKVLPRGLAKNATMLQRFLKEAKSSESLQHPNIVEIFDRGSDGGRYYIALEYLPGGDYQEWVRGHGPLPVRAAVEVVKGVARGLRYAATRGLIHRDIKPANLLRGRDGRVKVADLGLALQLADDDERVTRDGTTVGTVDYMAPEQARDSRATSVRSDIYSLGCTFYFLLTGQPPFPKGAMPEKLRMHAYEPPPKVRRLRPDVPPALASLIERMMAKKPEDRFHDHDELLDALERVGDMPPEDRPVVLVDDMAPPPGVLGVAPGVLDLFADDEPLPMLPTGEWPEPGGGGLRENISLRDLMRDDSKQGGDVTDSEGFQLGADPFSRPGLGLPPTVSASIPEAPSRKPTHPGPNGSSNGSNRGQESSGAGEATETPEHGPARPGPSGFVRPKPPARMSDSDRTEGVNRRLLQGLILGMVLLVAAFFGMRGLDWAPRTVSDALPRIGDKPEPDVPAQEQAGAERVTIPRGDGGELAAEWRPLEPWTEPAEPEATSLVPPDWDLPELETLGIAGVVGGGDMGWPSPLAIAERAGSGRNREALDTLRRAFDTRSGTIEIADNGPFFEQDLKVSGASRGIRGAEGIRPMVVLEPPRLPSVRERVAAVVLDGQRLVVQGIDLVVRAEDLPPKQSALFLCLGSELILRDCTITIEGRRSGPLSVVQAGQGGHAATKGTRIRFERTTVRGEGISAVSLAEGPAAVELVESVVLGGDEPVIRASGAADEERSLALLGSVVAGSGPMIELAGSAGREGARPLKVRSYGCHLAKWSGGSSMGLVVGREIPGGTPAGGPQLDWRGKRNRYTGWPSVAVEEGKTESLLADFQAIQAWDPEAEVESTAESSAPARPEGYPWVDPTGLSPPGRQVGARPRPHLREWTIGRFAAGEEAGATAAGTTDLGLVFDADDPRWEGDLGRYLAEQAASGAPSIRVEVRGSGRKWVTPVELEEGVSLFLRVQPGSPGGERLVWMPREGSKGDALISVRGGTLRIEGAVLERDAGDEPGVLVQVVQGRLELERCWLRGPGQVEPGGGDLISFGTEGSRPWPPGVDSTGRSECVLTDCVLVTGGTVVTAGVGAGLIRVRNCAIASGEAAFRLRPQKVARQRFHADLVLDSCTIAALRDVVHLDAWPGATVGPDRPWVISSRSSLLIDPFDRGPAPSTTVLLRSEAVSLARGGVIWQSEDDAFDVRAFVTTGDSDPTPASYADPKRDWMGFWGPSHVLRPREARGLVRLAREKLRMDLVEPADLVVLPADPRIRVESMPGARMDWLGVEPNANPTGPVVPRGRRIVPATP